MRGRQGWTALRGGPRGHSSGCTSRRYSSAAPLRLIGLGVFEFGSHDLSTNKNTWKDLALRSHGRSGGRRDQVEARLPSCRHELFWSPCYNRRRRVIISVALRCSTRSATARWSTCEAVIVETLLHASALHDASCRAISGQHRDRHLSKFLFRSECIRVKVGKILRKVSRHTRRFRRRLPDPHGR